MKSSSSFDLIKRWPSNCLDKHSKCRLYSSEFWIRPTRLIYLYYGQARLVHTSGMATMPNYLTLSHCWGTIKLFKLTRENLADLEIAMPEGSLCQTFQDALFITRSLVTNKYGSTHFVSFKTASKTGV